ncbi:MAG: type II secretion system protein GspG [Planctomycetota bacterium]|nr:MAG: type II secretion system protein GspG [Planctomycetota bacterium]
MKLKYRLAFTLVELMVVIVIIGILAGVVVTNIGNRGEDSKIERAKVDIMAIRDAMDFYRIDTGSFPEKVEDLVEQPADVAGWKGPYLRDGEIPIDPWGNPYVYERCYDNPKYEFKVISWGPNKEDDEGKGDDITNIKQ